MAKQEYLGKKILVLGLGVSGRAAAGFLLDRGASVAAIDKNASIAKENKEIEALKSKGLQTFTEGFPLDPGSFSLVVSSPGVPPSNHYYRAAQESGVEVVGEIELAFRHAGQPILAVSGTNGKTTTATLLGHILRCAGKKVSVLGNIGTPLIAGIAEDAPEVIVCELSSYQLETLRSKKIDAGAILNITPDHLDRYENMEHYASAKIRMGQCIKDADGFYIGEQVFRDFKHLFGGKKPKLIGFNEECDVYCDGKKIFIKDVECIVPETYRNSFGHDVENMMAACALSCEYGVEAQVLSEAFRTFTKPPHRIEFVKKVSGVSFYNDSKGTNPDAVVRAVESMPGKTVLIAGGAAKGCSFSVWKQAFKGKVQEICAIGESKHQLKSELSEAFKVEFCDSLESAVGKAFAIAQKGECVLLSPGCASLDMFKNYEHRGNRFKEIVRNLEGRSAYEPS